MSQTTFNAALQSAGFNDTTTKISKVNLKNCLNILGNDLYSLTSDVSTLSSDLSKLETKVDGLGNQVLKIE